MRLGALTPSDHNLQMGPEHGHRNATFSWLHEYVSCSVSVCNQADQALRDDLPRLFDQFVNNLTGWLDLSDQADALTR